MRATVMYEAGDVRVENVPDASVIEPTDALVRVTGAAICGSDLWPYKTLEHTDSGRRMGHEAIGVVDAVGADVATVKPGDLVIMPFAYSDGTCEFCHDGLQTSCEHGGFFGSGGDVDGAQAEAVRVPQADGTLAVVPGGADDALMPSLLTLSDVMGTGQHAALVARVAPGKTVAVVGDGAVGLCGVIAAKRLGAERIILLGRHEQRIALAREFGATDVVRERNEEAAERVREVTGGGAHSVLECVGLDESMLTAIGIARAGGAVGRVGVPQSDTMRASRTAFYANVTIGGGPAPARAYIDELVPDVLEGKIEPGRVFDRTAAVDEVPDGYRAMNDREAIKVLIRP
jgi:threonine dehydrogenase-like Zn-dependent dehydrogenase